MGLLKKISQLFSSPGAPTDNAYWVKVKCQRCGEIIQARINLNNDLSLEYDEGRTTYFCRKTLIGEASGERLCFQRIEIELTFDENRRLLSREITGGQFVAD
jgi:hypothetical protein